MSTEPVRVTIVTTRGCHLCEDALQALASLGEFYSLSVDEVTAHSPRGQALVLTHGSGIFPLVLVGGEFFSAGRLARRKLCRLLDQHGPAMAARR